MSRNLKTKISVKYSSLKFKLIDFGNYENQILTKNNNTFFHYDKSTNPSSLLKIYDKMLFKIKLVCVWVVYICG